MCKVPHCQAQFGIVSLVFCVALEFVANHLTQVRSSEGTR